MHNPKSPLIDKGHIEKHVYNFFVSTDGMMKKLEFSLTETCFKLLFGGKYRFLTFVM